MSDLLRHRAPNAFTLPSAEAIRNVMSSNRVDTHQLAIRINAVRRQRSSGAPFRIVTEADLWNVLAADDRARAA